MTRRTGAVISRVVAHQGMPGPMYWSTDLTLTKSLKITERQSLEFRFAIFNPLNHSLASFNTNDNNLHLTFKDSNNNPTTVTTNAMDPSHSSPGPSCQAFGYPAYAFGHRVIELVRSIRSEPQARGGPSRSPLV